MQRPRHQEFIRFLNAIERQVPAGKVIHVILDNYATHKHPKVLRWLGRHPRFVCHFTPTSCSWLNAVETFFSVLTRRRLRHGVFRSVVDLQAAINRFIADHNAEPEPFVWTADPEMILDKVARGTQAFVGTLAGSPLGTRLSRNRRRPAASPSTPVFAVASSNRAPCPL
jgi:transposase